MVATAVFSSVRGWRGINGGFPRSGGGRRSRRPCFTGSATRRQRFERLQWTRRVSLIRCTAGPNHGHTISLKQITVAIHDGAALEMEWRAPGSDRLRSDIVSHGRVSMGDADVPFWTRWRTPLSIVRFGIDKSFMTQVWRSEFDGANGHSIENVDRHRRPRDRADRRSGSGRTCAERCWRPALCGVARHRVGDSSAAQL